MVATINERKYLDWQRAELRMNAEAPKPTPRTMNSRHGFGAWIEYVHNAEKARMKAKDPSKWDWPGAHLPLIPGYVIAFDHVEYAKPSRTLVLYDYGVSDLMTRKRAVQETMKASTSRMDDIARHA